MGISTHQSVYGFFDLIVTLQWEIYAGNLFINPILSTSTYFQGCEQKNLNVFQEIGHHILAGNWLGRVLAPTLEMKSCEAFSETLLSGRIKVILISQVVSTK